MISSGIRKHSIIITGHKTSVSLEDEFWKSIREIASGRGESLSELIAYIDAERAFANLSSAIRLFVLRYYREELDRRGGVVGSLESSNSIENAARR